MLKTPKSALNIRHLIRSIVQASSIRVYYIFLLCLLVSSLHVKPWSLNLTPTPERATNSWAILAHQGNCTFSVFAAFTIFFWLAIIYLCRRSSRFAIAHFLAENVSSRTTCSHNSGEPSRNDPDCICKTSQNKARLSSLSNAFAMPIRQIRSAQMFTKVPPINTFNSCLGSAWPPLGERKMCASCCRARTYWWSQKLVHEPIL